MVDRSHIMANSPFRIHHSKPKIVRGFISTFWWMAIVAARLLSFGVEIPAIFSSSSVGFTVSGGLNVNAGPSLPPRGP
jgi:hypothetical protein